RVPAVVLIALLSVAGSFTSAQTATFDQVMRRVHEYVTVYEDHQLSTIIARERYFQQVLDVDGTSQGERTLLSDYLLLQLRDGDWVAVRDVYDVDGMAVADRAARLRALFSGPPEQLGGRAMEMARQTADFNLRGTLYYRTLNLPTFALRILRPVNRK